MKNRIYLFDAHNNATLTHTMPGKAVPTSIPGVYAARTADALPTRDHSPEALHALGVLKYVEEMNFHPRTGEQLVGTYPKKTPAGEVVYPTIAPAVIGIVEHEDKILLARNRERSDFFSLIAGYVELGETFEQAFIREVEEETGLTVTDPTYVASQAWPFTGSIMVGMRATCADATPRHGGDGEIMEWVWASKADVTNGKYTLPRPGSISLSMICAWAEGTL